MSYIFNSKNQTNWKHAMINYFRTTPTEIKLVWAFTAATTSFGAWLIMNKAQIYGTEHLPSHRHSMINRLNSRFDGHSSYEPEHQQQGARM
ncbi:hypothetical protein MP228_006868 [Amoeboaphelidium protococcarum]|nr:hypothetical protein MP228_006868 [Amoeboaphelidium protococcarum]